MLYLLVGQQANMLEVVVIKILHNHLIGFPGC